MIRQCVLTCKLEKDRAAVTVRKLLLVCETVCSAAGGTGALQRSRMSRSPCFALHLIHSFANISTPVH